MWVEGAIVPRESVNKSRDENRWTLNAWQEGARKPSVSYLYPKQL